MSQIKPPRPAFADGIIELDPESQSIYCHDKLVRGAGRVGYQLTSFLVANVDAVQTKKTIYREVWRRRSATYDTSVRVKIKQLRNGFGQIDDQLADPETGAIVSVQTPLLLGYCAVSSLTETKWPEKMSGPDDHIVSPDGLVDLNTVTGHVKVANQYLNLSRHEFLILQSLMRNYGHPMSKDDLLQDAWGHIYYTFANLRVTIKGMRGKLKAISPELGDAKKGLIRNDRQTGYSLANPAND